MQNNNTKPIKSVSIYATSAKLKRRVDITARAQITCCFFVCLSGLNVCLRYAIKLKFPLNAFPAALTTHSLIMTPLSFILACSFEMNCYIKRRVRIYWVVTMGLWLGIFDVDRRHEIKMKSLITNSLRFTVKAVSSFIYLSLIFTRRKTQLS